MRSSTRSAGRSFVARRPIRLQQRRRLALLAAAAAGSAIAPLFAAAAEKDWNPAIANGNWNTPGNWLQNAVPVAGDNAFVVNADATNRVVTYDYAGPAITLLGLRVDNTGGGTNTLQQAANALTAQTTYVGYAGRGNYLLSGGTLSNTSFLDVGRLVGATGVFTQTGGQNTAADFYIGDDGNGTYAQSGVGRVNVTGTNAVDGLYLGYSTNGTGAYSLGGSAVLSVASIELVGYNGRGTFNQSGGTHNAGGIIYVGDLVTSSGTYTLNAGNLNAPAGLYVGNYGTGAFVQSGGTNAVAGALVLGNVVSGTSVANGSYQLTGGTLSVNAPEYVGLSGVGSFNQSGGTHTTTGGITTYIGFASGGSGTYALSGTGVFTDNNTEIVGYVGNGAFVQTGGTHSVNGSGLYVGFGAAATGSYALTNGTLAVLSNEYVGYSGTGTVSQAGGIHTTPILDLGYNLGATGNYNLSGGLLSVTQYEKVGLTGNATFNQTGGTHTVGIGMHLGGAWNVSGTQRGLATYNLSAGSLTIGTTSGASAEGFLGVGTHDDNGVFNQSGGLVTINGKPGPVGYPSDGLYIGQDVGTTGTYNLSNGATLVVNTDEYVGTGGNGFVNQTGGVHTVNGPNGIFLGLTSGTSLATTPTGVFNLSGGVVNTPNVYVGGGYPGGVTNTIAAAGYGLLNVTGGTLNASNVIQVFNTVSPASVPSGFTLNGGAVNAAAVVTPDWSRLNFVNGTLNLNGGASSGTGTLAIGSGPGVAALTQSSSSTLNATNIAIGSSAASTATYAMTGAFPQLTVSGTEYVGYLGNGAFVQSGGNHNVGKLGVPSLYVGFNTATTGAYTLNGGYLSVGGYEYVGASGAGTFYQNGGYHGAGGFVDLGLNVGSTGIYNMNAGNLTPTVLYVGDQGNGTFNQTGGLVTANGTNSAIYLGYTSNGAGVYNLSGGSLNAYYETISAAGNGTFNQTGGSHRASTLYLGNWNGSGTNQTGFGTYNLSGGTLITDNTTVSIWSSSNTFNQTGGFHETGALTVGNDGPGTYNLSGNSELAVGSEVVGSGGLGILNQTGGAHAVDAAAGLAIGASSGGTGIVNYSGGALRASNVYVGGSQGGAGGLGILNVSNGVQLNVLGLLKVWDNPNGATAGSSVNLYGGTIVAGAMDLTNNPAALNWVAGSIQLTNAGVNTDQGVNLFGPSLILDPTRSLSVSGDYIIGGFGTGAVNVAGGSLAVKGGIQLKPGGTLAYTAGSLVYGSLNQNGGTLTNDLVNGGTFNYASGPFLGRLVNQGAVSFSGNFTAPGGIENDTAMTVPGGVTVTANGPGLDNEGTFTLANGALAGAGVVNNATFNAAGTINPAVANYGAFTATGVLTASGGAQNYGTLSVPLNAHWFGSTINNFGLVTLAGGAVNAPLANNAGGAIQGSGNVFGSVANNAGATVFANGSAPLLLTNLQGNAPGATLKVAAGSTLNVANAWTNNGVVTLLGPGATLGGAAFNNPGLVRGAGLLGVPVVNTGVVRAESGELDLAGSGNTNAPTGQLQVPAGGTLVYLQGLANNAGAIDLSGGTFDNGNQPLNNTGQILGNGTVRTGGLLNAGTVFLADVNSAVFGPVTNTGQVKITANTSTFYGFFNNAAGSVKTTGAVARFLGGASVGGTYTSDPSDNYFTDLTVTPTGALQGGAGDRFLVTGNYTSTSANAAWGTRAAQLRFTGGGTHALSVTGPAGNATWGSLVVDAPDTAVVSGNAFATIATSNSGQTQQPSGTSFLGAVTGAGSLTVGGGGTALVTVASFSQGSVTVADGGTLTVPIATPSVTNTTNSLSLTGSGRLDLGNHALVTNTALPTIRQYAIAGYAGGAWNGAGGIGSTYAAANHSYGVGYGTNSTGQTIAKVALLGDTTLKGSVTFGDYQNLLSNFGKAAGGTWAQGDTNYDGAVGFGDYQTLLSNFGKTSAVGAAQPGGAASPADAKLTGSASANANASAAATAGTVTPAGAATTGPQQVALSVVTDPSTHTYQVFATVLTNDNAGLATYGIDVIGTNGDAVATSKAKAPRGFNADQGLASGFSTQVSNGNAGIEITASQALAYAGANDPSQDALVYQHVGQQAGSQDGATWAYPVLIANGTYTGNDPNGLVAQVHPGDQVQVLAAVNNGNWQGPGNVLTATVVGVPEPTTLGLLAVGAGGLLARRRRRAGTHSVTARRSR